MIHKINSAYFSLEPILHQASNTTVLMAEEERKKEREWVYGEEEREKRILPNEFSSFSLINLLIN